MRVDRKYEPIKEGRGNYYAEYNPPIKGNNFAKLNLVFIGDFEKINVIEIMEKEIRYWLNRFPIPLFVSAFNKKGNVIHFDGIKESDHLIGFYDHENKICLNWKLLSNDNIPHVASDLDYVDNLFSNIPFTTYPEIDEEKKKKRNQIRSGWVIVFIWGVIIPILIAIFENYNHWISFVAMIYSITKAIQKGLELTGRLPKSKRKKKKEAKEQLMKHYYYHCQMNPEGFKRLMLENLEKMEMDNIQKEAEALGIKTD